MDQDDFDEYNPQGGRGGKGGGNAKSSKRGGDIRINYRAPRISFAAKLESIIMQVASANYAIAFRQPVPRNTPGYYERVTNPICLDDVREKIASYQYDSTQPLLDDLEQMVNNSILYNGANHPITKNAKKVKELAKSLLEHDRTTLGAEHDMIGILQEIIRKNKMLRK